MAAPPAVLIADDDAVQGSLLNDLFRSQGHQVELVRDGAAALKLIGHQTFDLIIASQSLPQASGLELLATLRAASTGRYVPMVLMVAQGDRATRVTALKAGADEVVVRPADPEELRARSARLLEVHQQIEELRRQSEELRQLSVTDGLTQVFNHRFFQERLKAEFRRAQRYEEHLALMLVDLDHFKQVNDRFGHQTGDAVLQEVAAAVKANVRDTDIVARYGGEEFAVLLPKTPLPGCLTVAERVWAGVRPIRVGPDRTHAITLSIGISCYPSQSIESPELLLQTADEALYRAKREGRNRICVYESPAPGRS